MPFFQRFAADLADEAGAARDRAQQDRQARAGTARHRGGKDRDRSAWAAGLESRARENCRRKNRRSDTRWTFAMFGYLKPYKGIDLVIEAAGLLRDTLRGRARFVIAGSAQMDIAPLWARIAELGIADLVELRVGYLSNEALGRTCWKMPTVSCFPIARSTPVAPITWPSRWANGSSPARSACSRMTLSTVKPATLVPPSDSQALARALEWALENRAKPAQVQAVSSWRNIGSLTKPQYRLASEHMPSARCQVLYRDGAGAMTGMALLRGGSLRPAPVDESRAVACCFTSLSRSSIWRCSG